MNGTQPDMQRLARLAGLEPEREELTRLGERLEKLLACMHTLDSMELPEDAEQKAGENVLRADESAPGMDRALLLANAPRQDGEYVLVPRTVGEVDG